MNLHSPFCAARSTRAFTFADFLVVLAALALLLAVVLPMVLSKRARSRQATCEMNLKEVTHAVLSFAEDNGGRLPDTDPTIKGPLWWFYKEQVKGYLGLRTPSSSSDKVFACPSDRGYEDGKPFRLSAKFDYGSYNYNGVNIPGLPHIAERNISSIKEPNRTLLVMEWTAHAPLSWHRSETGRRNQPFYNNAMSVVSFVDGHVDFIPIYYDGINAAYTRDPIPGYAYKYSGD
jgi:competence protein ComGC